MIVKNRARPISKQRAKKFYRIGVNRAHLHMRVRKARSLMREDLTIHLGGSFPMNRARKASSGNHRKQNDA